jgi:hypothetical protein
MDSWRDLRGAKVYLFEEDSGSWPMMNLPSSRSYGDVEKQSKAEAKNGMILCLPKKISQG